MDAAQGMLPHRVRVLGGEMLMTGRVNGTKAAPEQTAEQVLVIRDPALAAHHTQNWRAQARHRQRYVGRGVRR